MSRGYFPWEACNTISLQLEAWCARYTDANTAAAVSAGALAMLLREAMNGNKTPTGPYRRLYKIAEFEMRWMSGYSAYDIPFGIWRAIPDPGEALMCEFTRAYACVYMGAELAQIDLLSQHIIARSVAGRTHSLEGYWEMPGDSEQAADLVALVNRIVAAWENHAHAQGNCCSEFNDLWNHESNKAHAWYEKWRRDAKGGSRGPNQQTHHPRYYRPPDAESLLG